MAKSELMVAAFLSAATLTGCSAQAETVQQDKSEGPEQIEATGSAALADDAIAPKTTREWLDSTSTRIGIHVMDDAVIYFTSFVKSEELSEAQLEVLNEGPLEPGSGHHEKHVLEALPIELIELPANEHRLKECTAMIQVGKLTKAEVLTPETERVLSKLRNRLPNHPLGENCEELDPWKGLEKSRQGLIEVGGSKAIYHQGHLTVVDPNLRCSQFAKEQSGSFEITPQTKAIVRSYSNRMPAHLRDSYRTSRIAATFESGLKQGLARAGQPKIQMLANDYLADAPGVIRIDYSIIDDDEADAFCFVSKTTQGSALRTDVLVTPREGLKAEWTDFVDSKPAWKGMIESRDFGRQIGVSLAN